MLRNNASIAMFIDGSESDDTCDEWLSATGEKLDARPEML